jgi:hypothetical protein
MEELCEFILLNIDYNIDEYIDSQSYNYNNFYDLNNCINIIYEFLGINKTDIHINKNNLFKHREVVISFKFKDRKCEFYENYGFYRNYLCIRIMPVE